ncbi:MAG: hypothetical protein PUK40_01010 [Actinomycetaceae bacterium]|nr:hypothetical protein [Arcanobacterium sp.]MDD7504520.1 hypothetical protein [Actinomycetaceae bacterium]MDY6142811.1 hypothetical protein [Arcanobacterium sp.]
MARARSAAAFGAITALAVALFVLTMILVGARLDTAVDVPTPDSSEQARQESAIAAMRISEGTARIPEAANITFDPEQWALALGGIWEPWPGGAPQGYTNPTPDLASPSQNAQQLADEIHNFTIAVLSLGDNDSASAQQRQTLFVVATQALLAQMQLTASSDVPQACGAIDYERLGGAASSSTDTGKNFVYSADLALQQYEYEVARLPFDARDNISHIIGMLHAAIDASLAHGAPDDRILADSPIENLDSRQLLAKSLAEVSNSAALGSAELEAMASYACTLAAYTDAQDVYAGLLTTVQEGTAQ